MLFVYFLPLLFLFSGIDMQFSGQHCTVENSGGRGMCVELPDCQHALDLLKMHKTPQNCGFHKFTPIVCCPLDSDESSTIKTKDNVVRPINKQCALYYQDKGDFFSIAGFNGVPSLAKEFPHMAILGYGVNVENVDWGCGGSLISDQFVLTAGHCLNSREQGPVKFVRLGDLDIKNTTDDAEPQDFTVLEVFAHPQYRPPSHYHDIALIKLDRPIKPFTDYIKPACLYTSKVLIQENFVATGWGKTGFLEEPSSILLKMFVNYISTRECGKNYVGITKRKLARGIDDDVQICAGHETGTDTCPGDSGGPLQIKYPGQDFHAVVGITSFGKACGIGKSAGVYTRVSHYITWIEKIVWNN